MKFRKRELQLYLSSFGDRMFDRDSVYLYGAELYGENRVFLGLSKGIYA